MALTIQDKLNALLESGVATHTTVTWGRGYRDVILLGGKKYQYNGYTISRILKNKIFSMYIDMPATSSNQNIVINDILSGDVGENDSGKLNRNDRIQRRKHIKSIQKFVRTFFDKIKGKNHDVQIVYEITSLNGNDTLVTKEYVTPVFDVYGGHYKLKKSNSEKSN